MRLLLFVAGVFLSVCCFGQSPVPMSRAYDNSHEDLSRSVWGMIQDSRGILYLATSYGVVEYDGKQFNRLNTPPAYGIITDTTGEIYVSCKDDFGQLVQDDRGIIRYKSLFHFSDPVVKFEEVSMAIAPNKVSVTSYNAALVHNRRTKTTSVTYPDPGLLFSNNFIRNDTTYVSVMSKGLHYVDDGKLTLAPYGDWFKNFHNSKMNTNLPLADNQRLLVFGPNLIKYSGSGSPPTLLHLSNNFLKDSYLYSSFTVGASQMMITTVNKGAVLFDTAGTVINIFNKQKRLPGNSISNGLTDQSGNIWFALEYNKAPLVKTETGKDISLWNESTGLAGQLLAPLQMDGKIYITTTSNLYELDASDNAIGFLPYDTYYITNWVALTDQNSQSRLLVSLGDFQVGEYRNGRIDVVSEYKNGFRMCGSKIHPSRLYVQSEKQFGYLQPERTGWKYIGLDDVSNPRAFYEDRHGFIWFLFDNKSKIARLNPAHNEGDTARSLRYFSGPALPADIRTILSLHGQLLFVAATSIYTFDNDTNQFELWRGTGKKLYNLLLQTSMLSADTVNHVIHLVSNNKLTSVALRPGGDTLYITNPYKRFESIGGIVGVVPDRNGVLWIAGNDGIIRYDPSKDKKNYDQEFQCLIRSVVLGNDSLLAAGGLANFNLLNIKPALPYRFDKLIISYAAPFFDKEEETRYSHRLIGRDKAWSTWEQGAVKEYNDLAEGTYTFQVKAMNMYGKKSRLSSFTFTINPPWFRTWWMYLIYVAGLLFFISIVWRWRTRSLRKREKDLQELVFKRTVELVKTNHELKESHHLLVEANKQLESSEEELKQGNEELSATNDHLKLMQKQLVDQEKMASLGQLTAGIAHEINNPINFISGGVQALQEVYENLADSLSKNDTEEAERLREEVKSLMTSINNGFVRTSAIIRSLRTFSSPVESIDEQGRVDVKECVQDALTLLRDKAAKSDVQITLNFAHTHGAKANASLLTQVFVNLVDNAIYALRGISTERTVSIVTGETDNHVVIKVKDNAGSIPPKVIDRIFEPFFTTKEVGTGTGLGLWISYSIIEKHSGSIKVTSSPEAGTEFTILVPIGQPLPH